MDIFWLLFKNLLPLYVIIALGYAAGRIWKLDRDTLASIAIYICMPVVVFGFVAQLKFQPEYVVLPLVSFSIGTIMSFLVLAIAKPIYHDKRANLLAMCASMGNTGYFGLPLVLLLFEQKWVAIYMFMLLGITIHEATVGYYIASRGAFDVRQSLLKLLKFPTIYAISAGLLVNYMHIGVPEQFITYWTYFKGCYVVIGMMIIGVALAKTNKLVFGPKFLMLTFLGKFILWPFFAWVFVWADTRWFHLFETEIHNLILVLSIVPPSANITAFAAQMNMNPEKAATTVLVGTIFALVYIPAMLMWLGIG